MRQMSSGAEAAFASDEIRPVFLVELQFGSGAVRLTTIVGQIQWSGETWYGCGVLGSIGDIEETAESRAVGQALELSGVPLPFTTVDGDEIDILRIAAQENWQQRPGRILFGVLDTGLQWRVEPFQVRKGLMDVMVLIDDGKTAGIRINLESPYIDLNRAEDSRYTDEDQRARHPGDRGCAQVAALQEKEVRWNLS